MSNAAQPAAHITPALHRRPARAARLANAPTGRPSRLSVSRMPSDRSQDFSLFAHIASRFFRNPESGGRRWALHNRMLARAGYHVAPGLRDAVDGRGQRGGQRFFEVYYGSREIHGVHDLSSERLNSEWRSVQETGAALLYRQGDDGAVTVYLYPAKTDRLAPVEDAIILDRITETAALTGKGLMARHWRALRAYAEVTSLDGEPSTADSALIAWLRLTKPQIRAHRVHPPQTAGAAFTVAALSLSAVLGAAVFALSTMAA